MTTPDITQQLVATIDAEIARLNDLKRKITGEDDGPILTVKRGFAGIVPGVERTVATDRESGVAYVANAPVAKTAAKKTTKKSPTKGNEAVLAFLADHPDGVGAEALGPVVHKKGRNLTRHLVRLIDAKVIGRKGKGRGTLYVAR